MYVIIRDNDHLAHYGVPGQEKGKRRYQNPDGSLTPEGREHYGVGDGQRKKINKYEYDDGSLTKKGTKEWNRMEKWSNSSAGKHASGTYAINAYGEHKVKKAALVGVLLGGVVGGVAAGLVTQHRYHSSGRDFANKFFNQT